MYVCICICVYNIVCVYNIYMYVCIFICVYNKVAPLHASTPDFLTAGIEKEDKEEVVKHHKTRFLKAACDVSVPLISTEENSCREKQRKRCQKRRNEDNEQRQEQKKRKMK